MNTKAQKKISRSHPLRFDLIAEAVCLDFVNTLDDRFSDEPKELLKTYFDLVRFGEDTGILDKTRVDLLFARSQAAPEAAQCALRTAIELREAMFAVFTAIANRKPVPAGALAVLNQYMQAAAQHAQLVPAARARLQTLPGKVVPPGACFEWRFDATPDDFEYPLWVIARSAADLLTSEQAAYVRTCASKTCQWFFLDTSKNHRRRWCDMTKCGNRAKVRAFYSRKKRASE